MRKTLASLALASTLLFSGACKENSSKELPKEYTPIKGTVFSETYMPASGGFMPKESRYSFSLDIEKGRKTFEVVGYGPGTKESVDALIEKGTKVEVQVEKGKENETFHKVSPEGIRVIQ